MNNVSIVGRLVKDIEVRKAENGKDYAFITVAVSRSYKNDDGEYEADFIDVQLWDEIAVNSAKYLHKGDSLSVEGSLVNYKDKKNHTQTTVMARRIHFLNFKSSEKEA